MKQIEMGEAITGFTTYETTSEAEGYFHSWGRGGKSFCSSEMRKNMVLKFFFPILINKLMKM